MNSKVINSKQVFDETMLLQRIYLNKYKVDKSFEIKKIKAIASFDTS